MISVLVSLSNTIILLFFINCSIFQLSMYTSVLKPFNVFYIVFVPFSVEAGRLLHGG